MVSNPGALLTLGIFAGLVTAWWLFPNFFWPVPDPEGGSGGTSSGVDRAPEPPPATAKGFRQDSKADLCSTDWPHFAWRRWNVLGGDIVSRPFDTPEEAGRYRAALADPRRMTLIRLEDGRACPAAHEEACAAIREFVDRTRETAA